MLGAPNRESKPELRPLNFFNLRRLRQQRKEMTTAAMSRAPSPTAIPTMAPVDNAFLELDFATIGLSPGNVAFTALVVKTVLSRPRIVPGFGRSVQPPFNARRTITNLVSDAFDEAGREG